MSEHAEHVPTTSAEAVATATGRDWGAWFALLDAAGAAALDHQGIVAVLRDGAGLAAPWWQQHVAVEYEKARGLRARIGQSSEGDFQVGARRTLPVAAARAWEHLTTRPGRDAWLGPIEALPLEKGARFAAPDGSEGEVRVVRPGERLRLAWRPAGLERPTTLQLSVTGRDGRCTVAFHHERLPDAATRAAMRERWRSALDALEGELAPG